MENGAHHRRRPLHEPLASPISDARVRSCRRGSPPRRFAAVPFEARPVVAAIVDETRAALAKRILEQGLGLASPPPRVRLAVRGFIGFVEAASLDGLEHGDVDRVTLRTTLLHMVTDAVARATQGS